MNKIDHRLLEDIVSLRDWMELQVKRLEKHTKTLTQFHERLIAEYIKPNTRQMNRCLMRFGALQHSNMYELLKQNSNADMNFEELDRAIWNNPDFSGKEQPEKENEK